VTRKQYNQRQRAAFDTQRVDKDRQVLHMKRLAAPRYDSLSPASTLSTYDLATCFQLQSTESKVERTVRPTPVVFYVIREVHPPLSQWCILHIPLFPKKYKFLEI